MWHASSTPPSMPSKRTPPTTCGGILGGIGKTADNLATAFAGETFQINEMYPAYMAVAELQGEKKALGSMGDALAVRED